MIQILFVCHGNICRSPMAEFIMKHLVKQAGVSERFTITSAATTTEELGNDIYPNVKAELKRHVFLLRDGEHGKFEVTRTGLDNCNG